MHRQQKGGFRLDNDEDGKLKSIVGSAFALLSPEADFVLQQRAHQNIRFACSLSQKLVSPAYVGTLTQLATIAKTIVHYNQVFKEHPAAQNFFERRDVIASHVSLGALLFLTFMLEFEFFLSLYSLAPYFDAITSQGSRIQATVSEYKNEQHSWSSGILGYRNLPKTIPEILNHFTTRLDQLFYDCMEAVVAAFVTLAGLGREKIGPVFVPTIHHKIRATRLYEYIYVNWQEQLIQLCVSQGNLQGRNPTELKHIIMTTLVGTIHSFQKHTMQYVAEGTEMFSSFFYAPGTAFKQEASAAAIVGSCMTETWLEFYILTRLHVNPESLYLYLQLLGSRQGVPDYPLMFLATSRLVGKNIGHWSTIVRDNGNSYPLRVYQPELDNYPINFLNNRSEFILAFILPIFDHHYRLMAKIGNSFPTTIGYLNGIMDLTNSRMSQFATLFNVSVERTGIYPQVQFPLTGGSNRIQRRKRKTNQKDQISNKQ